MPRDKRVSIYPRRCSELWAESTRSGHIEILTDARLLLGRYAINETAGLVWRLCDGKHDIKDIATSIAEACDGRMPSRDIILRDVMDCLEELRREGLVTWPDQKTVDVLLVIPPFPTTYAPYASQVPEYSSPPLGLAYIAAVLREHGYRVAIEDLHINSAMPEDILPVCRHLEPKIVGITASTPSYPNAERVARHIKAWNSDVITVIGGAHVTGLPIEPASSGVFDFSVVGEGEFTMLELTDALLREKGDPRRVSGLVFFSSDGIRNSYFRQKKDGIKFLDLSKNDNLIYNPARTNLKNLDRFPRPARDLLDIQAYFQKGAIISTRGCPIDCNFCACSAIFGHTYRMHSVGYVLDEVEELIRKYNIRHFDFHDDTFNLINKRVFKFCDEIINRKLDFKWSCFCRAAQFNPEMANTMARAGCGVIQFGVESGNNHIIKTIKKRTSLKQIEEAVKGAAAAGIEQIACGFIVGHAQDTPETIQETIDFALHLKKIGATRLTLSVLTPYPGTEVFERANELGIRFLTTDWEQYIFSRVVIETEHLDKHTLRELYVGGLIKFLEAVEQPYSNFQRQMIKAAI